MDLNQIIAPARPLMAVAGQILIIVGLLKFFGVHIPISGGGLELAVAGYLLRSI